MGKFFDSITINAAPSVIRSLLSDLMCHPTYVPEGFKNYRYLSRETAGQGARAAIDLKLLGGLQSAELEVRSSSEELVIWHVALEEVDIDPHFLLLDRLGRTEVRMNIEYQPRMLSVWKIRRRWRLQLSIDQDIASLFGLFLSTLKRAGEKSIPAMQENSKPAIKTSVGMGETMAPSMPETPASSPDGVPKTAAARETAMPSATSASMQSGYSAPVAALASHKMMTSDNVMAREKSTTTSSTPASAPPKPAMEAPAMANDPASCLEAELVEGQGRLLKVGNANVAVFKVGSDIFALDNHCPHRGGDLVEGSIEGLEVVCPLHGWTFDLHTGECSNIPGGSVKCYKVLRQQGRVTVKAF